MTKEELEKEAYLYAKNSKDVQDFECGFDIAFKSYLASSEPREKQIQIDAKQIRALQKQNGELTDELTKKADTNHQLVEQMAKLNEKNAELKEALKGKRCNCMTYLNFKDLEKENAELKKQLIEKEQHLDLTEREWGKDLTEMYHYKTLCTKAKDHIKKLLDCLKQDTNDPQTNYYVVQYMTEAEQFLKDKTEQEEPYYVIVNMNCQYEICRKCPKSGLFKGTYEDCEKWIKEKLRKVEK